MDPISFSRESSFQFKFQPAKIQNVEFFLQQYVYSRKLEEKPFQNDFSETRRIRRQSSMSIPK